MEIKEKNWSNNRNSVSYSKNVIPLVRNVLLSPKKLVKYFFFSFICCLFAKHLFHKDDIIYLTTFKKA